MADNFNVRFAPCIWASAGLNVLLLILFVLWSLHSLGHPPSQLDRFLDAWSFPGAMIVFPLLGGNPHSPSMLFELVLMLAILIFFYAVIFWAILTGWQRLRHPQRAPSRQPWP